MLFVTTLFIFHVNYILQNLTTYVSVKLAEIVVLYKNPFKK